jgi:HEAT repeat protein
MGSARKLESLTPPASPSDQKGRAEFYNKLRTYYHSLHSDDRDEAIEMLAKIPDSDSARELIQLYQDCQWRSTRIKIIRALASNPSQRCLEFLFNLAQMDRDIPIAEEAIRALGKSQNTLAARFLSRFYKDGPEVLKPAVVGAIGQLADQTLVSQFLKDLPEAVRTNKTILSRNLVLALGELKCREAVPLLEEMLQSGTQRITLLSALISIGKISRNPKSIERFEELFRYDLFEHQLFLSVKNQIHLRSQWKLEDYLGKIFQGSTFHRTLPLELNGFNPEDVKEGLRLFLEPQHFNNLCITLSKLNFPGLAEWYVEFFKPDQLSPEQCAKVLESIGAHFDKDMSVPLNSFRAVAMNLPEKSVFERWIEAGSMSLPEAEIFFRTLVSSEKFKDLPEARKITTVNHLANYGFTVICESDKLREIGEIFDLMIADEKSSAVQARVLRACAHLGISTSDIYLLVKRRVNDPPLTRSCVEFLEMCPSKQNLGILLELLKDQKARVGLGAALLKAIANQSSVPEDCADLKGLLSENLSKNAGVEARYETLMFLSKHPQKPFLKDVLACLNSVEQLKLGAIIALRAFNDEGVADTLAGCLRDENESVVGRALDTLTFLPGLRAKRIVIDFLKDHPEDLEICDKVSRCLNPPDTPHPYFSEVLQGILDRFPLHPKAEELMSLKEKFENGSVASAGYSPKKGEDATALDHALSQKIASYDRFDEITKSALRSAEVPFLHPETYDEFIDKSASVLGFCKATDIVLERQFGRKHLFPKLESSLHEFQNAIHAIGLNEEYPIPDRVIRQLGLEKHFSVHSFPLHKAALIARDILSGRIVSDRFRSLDGLRAWAVVLLLFARDISGPNGTMKPLISLNGIGDEGVVELAKKLVGLQDIRNPASHRQTVVKFIAVDEVRTEVFRLLNTFQKIF